MACARGAFAASDATCEVTVSSREMRNVPSSVVSLALIIASIVGGDSDCEKAALVPSCPLPRRR